MSLVEIEQAKRNAVLARQRLDGTLVAAQQRLRPGNLAGEAWDGVKDKSAGMADGALAAARERPRAVAGALGILVLFLARAPLKRALVRAFSGNDEEEGQIVTRIETRSSEFSASAPIVDVRTKEGVS